MKLWKTVLKFTALILSSLILALFLVLNYNTYRPMPEALDAMKRQNVALERNVIRFEPVGEVRASIVFYQGGLVTTEAYAVLGQMLTERGLRVFMPRMPFNLAILNVNAFDRIYKAYDQGEPWFLGGHSLGGASAAFYVDRSPEHINGLFFLGAYPADTIDLKDLDVPVLSINASNDRVVDREKYNSTKALLPPETVYLTIEGGNHANYGFYGQQKGDGVGNLEREAQHRLTVEAIAAMVRQAR
jgi:alpha-beta hydrolase superfamily lysophospholipase